MVRDAGCAGPHHEVQKALQLDMDRKEIDLLRRLGIDMTAIVAHALEPRHALPHFVQVIGNADWASERIEQVLGHGRFFALGPEDMPANLLTCFDGWILPENPRERDGNRWIAPVSNLDDDFAAIVVQTASANPSSRLFFREPYLKLTDESTYAKGLEQIDAALYSRIEHRDISVASVIDAKGARSAAWMSFFMILAKPFSGELSFLSLMSHAAMIAVDAYDGESCLFWLNPA